MVESVLSLPASPGETRKNLLPHWQELIHPFRGDLQKSQRNLLCKWWCRSCYQRRRVPANEPGKEPDALLQKAWPLLRGIHRKADTRQQTFWGSSHREQSRCPP